MLDRTGYMKMLEADQAPETESRIANLMELLNAAVDAGERAEGLTEFLDHAALVSDADSVDSGAQVSLLTMHNAKGLEYPIVFIAGLEEGLFPHSRSLLDEAGMEEERRLCYVGMTRAEQRLYLSWARFRRRFGGGEPERSTRSRFIDEVPQELLEDLSGGRSTAQVDLYAERSYVRDTAKRNLYTGKTYNSVENISQFFADKGMPLPSGIQQAQTRQSTPAPGARPPAPTARPANVPGRSVPTGAKKGFSSGSTIQHPKYGRGTVLRKEGEGEDAKLTISFPGHGLKKIIAKYAGIKTDE
jgi:DNA helicase-2/ATP-dependent DNA helicase PcrA